MTDRREGRQRTVTAEAAASVLLLLVGLGAFAHHLVADWAFTVDDAFIVFRYARNLATGAGPTLNAGEPPVEGVSQVLWMAWMVVPHWLHLDVVTFAKGSGIGLTLLTFGMLAAVVVRMVRLGGGSSSAARFGAATAVAVLAALPATALHGVAGLCTPSFTFVILWLLAACADQLQEPRRGRARTIAIACLLAGLARPEGNLVAVVALATTWLLLPPVARIDLGRWAVVGYALPGLVYFAARWAYYGLPLPLPVYVKMNDPAAFGGAADGVPTALDLWWQFGWLVAVAALFGVWRWRRPFVPLLVAGSALFISATLPSHIMGYCWRYLYPAVPVFVAAAGLGTAVVSARVEAATRLRLPLRLAGGLVLPTVLVVVAAIAGAPEVQHFREVYARGLASAHEPLGRFLATMPAPAHPLVVAIGDAGAVPYRSGWRTIDTFGLNDPATARTGRHDSTRVLAAAPDVLVAISRSAWHFVPCLPWEADLVRGARAIGMQRVTVLRFADEYHLWVFAKPGPVATALANWSSPAVVPDPFGLAGGTIAADAAGRLQPLGLRYGTFELVDAIVCNDRIGLRTRGEWDPDQCVVVVAADAAGDEAPFVVDCRPDKRLTGMADGGDRVHTLTLPRAPSPGQLLRLSVIEPAPPYPRRAAADGRTSVEWRARP